MDIIIKLISITLTLLEEQCNQKQKVVKRLNSAVLALTIVKDELEAIRTETKLR